MEYDEYGRRRQEGFHPSGSENVGEEYQGTTADMRQRMEHMAERGRHTMTSAREQMTERGREAAEMARERMADMTERVPLEPRTMWIVGLATLFATVLAAVVFFWPKTWRRTGHNLGEMYEDASKSVRSMMR